MNWISIAQYILARTKEPSIVHRGVQAVGGLIAAWALTGPERWIGVILSVSALLGILMPDAATQNSGWNDASPMQKNDSNNGTHPVNTASNGVQRVPTRPRSNTVEAADRKQTGFGDRD